MSAKIVYRLFSFMARLGISAERFLKVQILLKMIPTGYFF